MNERLSREFWLHEFTDSPTAARSGIEVIVPDVLMPNLQKLVDHILQPLRDAIVKPVVISSGYRPPWLNKIVGGSKTSQHTLACAADIKAVGMTPLEVCRAIVAARLPFDQLIFEFGQWTHVSVAPGSETPRGQVMTALYEGGRPVYRAGLPK